MATETRTGELKPFSTVGGSPYHECVDCGTRYHQDENERTPKCNGALISRCPWCRPDSKPWQNGRGM